MQPNPKWKFIQDFIRNSHYLDRLWLINYFDYRGIKPSRQLSNIDEAESEFLLIEILLHIQSNLNQAEFYKHKRLNNMVTEKDLKIKYIFSAKHIVTEMMKFKTPGNILNWIVDDYRNLFFVYFFFFSHFNSSVVINNQTIQGSHASNLQEIKIKIAELFSRFYLDVEKNNYKFKRITFYDLEEVDTNRKNLIYLKKRYTETMIDISHFSWLDINNRNQIEWASTYLHKAIKKYEINFNPYSYFHSENIKCKYYSILAFFDIILVMNLSTKIFRSNLLQRMKKAWWQQVKRNKKSADIKKPQLCLRMSEDNKKFLKREAKSKKMTKHQLLNQILDEAREKSVQEILRQNSIG